MKDKKIIFETLQGERNPGYQLLGAVLVGVDGSKTLEITSVVPGAKHPDPHRLLSVVLPPQGFANFVELLTPHTKPCGAAIKTKKIIPYPVSYIDQGETIEQYSARCDAALAAAGEGAEFENTSEDITDQHEGETEVFYVP